MTDVNESKSQNARSKLRESFLRTVNELKGEKCQIVTYENSTIEAIFNVWKPDGSEIIVNDLKTPANIIILSALLRTPDLIAINFDKNLGLT